MEHPHDGEGFVPPFLSDDIGLSYVAGLRRVRTPMETAELLRPHLADAGITRIADVTGLDRVGLPVVLVVRPNSRSLAVSQGKGTDTDAAWVSGVMEAIELHHAERPELSLRAASYAGLRATGAAVLDPETLPLARESGWQASHTVLWAEASELNGVGSVWVPYELVHADATYPLMPGSGTFVRSTNGLASGNCRAEAVLHALCEVIERDALAIWDHSPEAERDARRIDPGTIVDAVARAVLDRFDAAGIDVALWDITSDIGVPAVRVVIVDREADSVLRPMPAAFGAGCHPDGRVAVVRALTEAAQSRLTAISGSRDDLTRARYRSFQHADALSHARSLLQHRTPRDASTLGCTTSASPVEDVLDVVQRLVRAGYPRIATLDLTPPGWPIRVVRAIVPGLEGPTESLSYRPGPRALAAQAVTR